MSQRDSNLKKTFRPLISSVLSTEQPTKFIPFKYCFSLQQIFQLKKYLPKTFKLCGVDSKYNFTKQELEAISKNKIKIKSVEQEVVKSQENKESNKIFFLQKDKIGALQWYKTISLLIPYNSKAQEQQTNAKIIDTFGYYLQNFIHFQNTLTGNLINLDNNQKQVKATLQQMKDIDLLIMSWTALAQANDDKVKLITINLPIVIFLQQKTQYNLIDLKQVIINQCSTSFQILLKHNFNTKVLINGKQQKRFVWLNSYCSQENSLDEEQKLIKIIGQSKNQIIDLNPEQKKKQYRFLVVVLFALIFFYIVLKIYPINPRQPIIFQSTQDFVKQKQEENIQEQIF